MIEHAFYLSDENETARLGQEIAHHLTPGLVIFLNGHLGAGKTTLVRALIRECGFSGKVKSPTYSLVEPYTITISQNSVPCYHFDLYRLNQCDTSFYEEWRDYFNDQSICLIEWANNAHLSLLIPDITIDLSLSNNARQVLLTSSTPKGESVLKHLNFKPNES